MQEESIYNIIPPDKQSIKKNKRYKSKFPYDIEPTCSTFCQKNTSKPGVSNVAGDYKSSYMGYSPYSKSSIFGPPPQERLISPQNYLQKGKGQTVSLSRIPQILEIKNQNQFDMKSLSMQQSSIFSGLKHECKNQLENVPKATDKPIYGLKSRKNYIISNVVNNILSSPPQMTPQQNFMEQKNYGVTPKYIQQRKEQIQREYNQMQQQTLQDDDLKKSQVYLLSEEEISNLKEGLKAKYDQVNQVYQSISYYGVQHLDSLVKLRKKNQCEQMMTQLEKDMEKLNKGYIFVNPSK